MSIKVFILHADIDRFQMIRLEDDDDPERSPLRKDGSGFEGRRFGDSWTPPSVYPDMLAHEVPDIWDLGGLPVLVLGDKALDVLYELVKYEELLPLPMDGEAFTLVNVLNTPNVLDTEAVESIGGPTGLITKYAFFKRRFNGFTLFRRPGRATGHLYCWENTDELDGSFRHTVLEHGLTGLWFEECWDSDVEVHPFNAFRAPEH